MLKKVENEIQARPRRAPQRGPGASEYRRLRAFSIWGAGESTFKRNRPSFAVLMVLGGGGGVSPRGMQLIGALSLHRVRALYVCLFCKDGKTALHLAAIAGHENICHALIDAGAEVNHQNEVSEL